MPYSNIEWETTEQVITDDQGKIIWKASVEFPSFFSDTARTVVSEKYLCNSARQPESSFMQLIDRVSDTITAKGIENGYSIPDDFNYLLKKCQVNQLFAFNSPVYFNAGLYDEPQLSACFIGHLEDTMDSILEAGKQESRIFKSGSGSGMNYSTLRSSKEPVQKAGNASGPVSFLKGHDTFAGVIRSGGVVRRSAKMAVLDVSHGDIVDFIRIKAHEEKKLRILAEAGFKPFYDDQTLSDEVSFQNTNLSVRMSADFLKAVTNDEDWILKGMDGSTLETLPASELMQLIGESAWSSGEPGVHFRDTINHSHTCPQAGSIESSNPCQPSFATCLTKEGIRTLADIEVGSIIWTGEDWTSVIRKEMTGVKPVYKYNTTRGHFIGTDTHRIYEDGSKIPVDEAMGIDTCVGSSSEFLHEVLPQVVLDGLMIGDGTRHLANKGNLYLTIGEKDQDYFGSEVSPLIGKLYGGSNSLLFEVDTTLTHLEKTYDRTMPTKYLTADKNTICNFLRGLYSANGSVLSTGNTTRITLKQSSKDLIQSVQLMLSSLGVNSYITTYPEHPVTFKNGSTHICKESYCLNISAGRKFFYDNIGFIQTYKMDKLKIGLNSPPIIRRETSNIYSKEYLGDFEVYSITVLDEKHRYWSGGVLTANCSEFFFLNDSACNLASINLVKLLSDLEDWTLFDEVVSLVIKAQDIICDFGKYPSEKIRKTSHEYRPLGIGFTNLGGLLMINGIPYGSEEAQHLTSVISNRMTSIAYRTSAELAEEFGIASLRETSPGKRKLLKKQLLKAAQLGAYKGYDEENHYKVIQQHRSAAHSKGLDTTIWDDLIKNKRPFRNAQVSLLAPTGCLTADTILLTDQGFKQMGQLGDVDGDQWQDIDINIDQEENLSLATKFYVNGKDSGKKIVTRNGFILKGTNKHQIRVGSDYNWCRLDDIVPGDQIILKRGGHELIDNNPIVKLGETLLTDDLAYIVGYYMANGCLKSRSVYLSVGNDHLSGTSDEILSIFPNTTLYDRIGHTDHYIFDKKLHDLFAEYFPKAPGNYGEGSNSIYFPDSILTSKTSVICSFIKGLFDADGTISNGVASYSTVSDIMSYQLQTIMLTMGILTYRDTITDRSGCYGKRPLHRIRVASKFDLAIFKDKIGFVSRFKQDRLEDLSIVSMRGSTIIDQGLIYDLYDLSEGLSWEVRADIRTHKYQGRFSTHWVQRLLDKYEQLRPAKINFFIKQDLLFNEVVSIEDHIDNFYDISVPDRNTYIANSMVNHNTISFMMDAATMGVEPEFAHRRYKALTGGGQLTIVNSLLEESLANLGYGPSVFKNFVETGILDVSSDDLPVFHCASDIPYKNHLLMMAAAQPFLSGSISKTVNMPASSTVEDIIQLYFDAHELGIKSVIVYRDGSKHGQVLTTDKKDLELPELPVGVRRKLPADRPGGTHKFTINGNVKGYINWSTYDTGELAEVFTRIAKEGSTFSGFLDTIATLTSMALQYGVPLEDLVDKMIMRRFEPAGFTSNPDVRFAHSIVDYIFRVLGMRFLPEENQQSLGLVTASIGSTPATKVESNNGETNSSICPVCGSMLRRLGSCENCPDCGYNGGSCS